MKRRLPNTGEAADIRLGIEIARRDIRRIRKGHETATPQIKPGRSSFGPASILITAAYLRGLLTWSKNTEEFKRGQTP